MTDLGNRLKEAREAKGYSLDDLQRITKIQKRYLIGIEEGSYDMMPGKFYVRAFIKQYCDAVGLPSELIFEEHKDEIPTTQEGEIPLSLSRVQTSKRVSESSSKVFDILPKLLIAVFVIGALIALWAFVQSKVGSNADSSDSSNQEQVAVDQKDPAPSEKIDEEKSSEDNNDEDEKSEDKQAEDDSSGESKDQKEEQSLEATNSSGYKTTYELKNTDKFQLELLAKGDTWVKVFNSKDEVLFEGLLKDKDKQSFDLSSDKQAYLVIGNAANTNILVNGNSLEYKIATDVVRQDIIINYTQPASQ
ncbi:helix-turn-helix domain-containing protein [Rossellomorea aquimaris]|uniref:helix-turn-helix domain-containing protein n=1 Tax=Rossellomorea aquimaris TaxID=189382 RepID=UPI0007D0559C|nr:RodZ domain-containing protein [Rossellomorea aquimaris]